ncbi:box C/D snoRNA protein 1-like [Salvia hispanica]|uniref:box C/D snoRNA protein 1-like n=1 Tax=Salvia hispanica TaxID=49212 RepID=UPI0020098501|nr:box C/D snoRNA protein 1-like [Salvia hispanica]XP_047975912.1 box C/D snoRNA protein 1-like [Salvia hispanica]XP_047975913.1 box C/D snoRNA protein 1-like [Salvia hispanica]
MEEKQEQVTSSDNKPNPNLCNECNINASKYKCPGCSLRTCSLSCVNSHKQRTACTGKRPLTNFVPISQFDDNQLVSDYKMLEDVKRIADCAQRTRVAVCGSSHFRLPHPLKHLRGAAASRRIKLLFLSSGMSRRVKNKTFYNHRKKSISWTVEWRFHSTDVVLLDHGIHENSTFFSVIENHLKPGPWNHQLKQFCDESIDSLKFFIRKYPKGPKSPFCQLDINAPIHEQLANIVILEYPVIHVFLPSHSYDFDVIQVANRSKVEPAQRDYPSPKGVTFKEEEIEDGGSPDPLVSDLLSHKIKGTESLPSQLVHSPRAVKAVGSADPDSRRDTYTITTEDKKGSSRSCIEELAEISDLDIDFESGFIDVYPNLDTADANSDEFLDFDRILLSKQMEIEEGEYLMEEELEEGEIA